MSKITNPWLNPLQRSYQQIKAKLIEGISKINGPDGKPLITDFSEGNIFVIITSLFSAIAEVLHYYIDNMSRETFFSTARRYESLLKHGALVDYHAKGAIAATVDVVLNRPVSSDNINAQVAIPRGTTFKDGAGNNWAVVHDIIWYRSTTTCKVPLIQHEYLSSNSLVGTIIPQGTNISIPLPSIPKGKLYEHGSLVLKINNETWVLVETFAHSKKDDLHFMVEVDSSQNALIIFGDGQFGKLPTPGQKITQCSMYVTNGNIGNIPSGSITNAPSIIMNYVKDATCSNPYPAGGGSNYEDFDMLKEHIPLSVKTLGVAVTKEDFLDLAKQVPGVNKAAIEYECGRKLNIYITPDNGTIASTALIDATYKYLYQHSPMTTWLSVKSAGVVDIMLDIEVNGRKSYSATEISNQVLVALMDQYSISNAEIGGKVRISDIYALIDNLSMVDYLHINKFYMKPWPTTIYGNSELKLGQYHLQQAKGRMTYLITFDSATTYSIRAISGGFSARGTVGSAQEINDTTNGNIFTLGISDNNYISGYRYSVVISEPNLDYEDPGFNLPLFQNASQLKLKVNEVV